MELIWYETRTQDQKKGNGNIVQETLPKDLQKVRVKPAIPKWYNLQKQKNVAFPSPENGKRNIHTF